jgi:peptidoglycan/LPS O-acetylase OafA/YrhL
MSDRSPILSLTGLRFVAALCVAVSHAAGQIVRFPADQPAWFLYLSSAAGIGMTLFFVLSGFVIHYNYATIIQEAKLRGILYFFLARFARLYPLYILCLVGSLAIEWWHGHLHHVRVPLPYYLLMLQTWRYVVLGGNNLIYQFGMIPQIAWSISTEWFFYVLYPAICFLLLQIPAFRSKVAAGAIFSLIAYIALFAIYTHYQTINQAAVEAFGPVADIHLNWQDCYIRWLVYFSPYSRISEFFLGCVSAALFMQMRDRPVTRNEARIGVLLLIATLVGIGWLYQAMFGPPYSAPPFRFVTFLHMSFGFAPLVAVMIYCCARYRTWLSAALSVPLVVLCGEVSYSVYLLHVVVIHAFSLAAIPVTSAFAEAFDLACMALALLVTVGISFGSYSLWESPMRRLIRRAFNFSPAYSAKLSSTPG